MQTSKQRRKSIAALKESIAATDRRRREMMEDARKMRDNPRLAGTVLAASAAHVADGGVYTRGLVEIRPGAYDAPKPVTVYTAKPSRRECKAAKSKRRAIRFVGIAR